MSVDTPVNRWSLLIIKSLIKFLDVIFLAAVQTGLDVRSSQPTVIRQDEEY